MPKEHAGTPFNSQRHTLRGAHWPQKTADELVPHPTQRRGANRSNVAAPSARAARQILAREFTDAVSIKHGSGAPAGQLRDECLK
jgi:hypothetical protein